ncbi:MAG: nodulation protein NfeD [Gammaproteobacteria bacterium]|nr:nodulation protein NfeD [Gammaproteobacteria bacterium]
MAKRAGTFVFLPLLLVVSFIWHIAYAENPSVGKIFQLTVADAIGPATHDYIERALDKANQQKAELVILRLDTPGGLDTSMRAIIKNITNSSVPVASYVSPTGARAASAGTFILYASHIAAMAPGTNLGAATPVQIGGLPKPASPDKNRSPEKSQDKQNGKVEKKESAVPVVNGAMKNKAINDAVAYIRGLAELHGRNQDWAEKTVREAASLPASEALELNVIDLIADNVPDLLKKLDGRKVKVLGEQHSLVTGGRVIEQIEPDWRSRLLSVITNPNIAYILMLIGIYGLIFELSNPGAIIPGTIGGIALLLALYSFQLLPINYAGMALILLGVALMVGEAFEPSFGILGIGGVVAFVFGSIILIDTDVVGYGIDLSIIVTFAASSVLIFVFVIGMAIKARRKKVVSGLEELVGSAGRIIEGVDHKGRVFIHSESWNAISDSVLEKDQQVRVTGVDGLTLKVEPLLSSEKEGE